MLWEEGRENWVNAAWALLVYQVNNLHKVIIYFGMKEWACFRISCLYILWIVKVEEIFQTASTQHTTGAPATRATHAFTKWEWKNNDIHKIIIHFTFKTLVPVFFILLFLFARAYKYTESRGLNRRYRSCININYKCPHS